jgi:membrane carboxypeptidase/penicillin-binding protein PbpC
VVSGTCGSSVTNSANLTVNSPVLVVTPPSNQTNCSGSTATFSVGATGTGLTYAWLRNGNVIGTSSSVSLNNISTTDGGTYTVVVSGTCGTAVTNSANLTVNNPVLVVTPPSNQTNCSGSTATFTVGATGAGLTYTWLRNGSVIGTSSSLSLNNISSTDAGTYAVVVSGTCGNSATNTASLIVNSTVLVVVPPNNQTNCSGATATFGVGATGTGLTYAWLRNGSVIGTNSSLSLNNISSTDAGTYTVVVSGICGSSVTNSASLTVNTPALVVAPPGNQTNCPGATVNFNVGATGTGLAYAWLRSGSVIGTNSSLSLINISVSDGGSYSVVVSGACGNPVTNTASLVVNSPILVLTPPGNQINCPGANVSFNVAAMGTGLTYSWQRNGSVIGTNSSLSLNNISSTDAGNYSVVVSGTCGIPATNSASLTVNNPVLVLTPPGNQINCQGANVSFNVAAMGTGLTYSWQRNGSVIGTSSSLSLNNITSSDAGTYTVVVSGACGNPVTNSASLTVNSPTLVVAPPVNQTNCSGATATFNVGATGTSLTYAWLRNGNVIGTTSSLSLNNISATDAGTYSVVVSGACGNSVTNFVNLGVNSPVLVVTPPVNQTNCPGATVNFNVGATGTGLAYAWLRNGTVIGTGSSLSLNNISATDAGTYGVVVSGTCGIPVTNFASLGVNSPVLVVTPPSNQTNCPGATVNFNVGATGTGLAYAWLRNGTVIGTSSSLSLNNISATDAGTYTVVVSGTCGNPVTNTVSLGVNSTVLVVAPPVNQTNCPGATVSFNVGATGTGLAYAWLRNGTVIGTNSSLSLNNISATDAGNYSVVVSGTCGNPVTNTVSLGINSPVLVVTPPSNQTNCPGATVNFNVGATGTGLAYAWLRNGTVIGTSSSLSLNNISATDAGNYSVVVSGTCGNPVTNSVSLGVNSTVVVVVPPVNQTNCPGATVSFNVGATGTGLAYTWLRNGSVVSTSSSLSLNNISATDAGTYNVVVSGTCGNPVTNTVSLGVNSTVLVVAPPVNQTNCPGATVNFNVGATGTGLTYAWLRNGSVVSTSSSLSLNNIGAANAGTYTVVVSGTCGNPVTNSVSLGVNSPVLVVAPPMNQTNCPGGTVNFNVGATGTGLAYAWSRNGTVIGTSSSLTLNNLSAADTGTYSVVVSGTCGNAVTNSVSLALNNPTVVVAPPISQTNCSGTSVSFNVGATGTGLAYAWMRNGNIISANSSLNLNNISAADAGTYSVVVSGACGTPVTNNVQLSINGSTAATPLASAIKNLGDSVTFSTTASGTGPFTFVWKKNGTVIPGKSSNSLTLTNIGSADAATYRVEVSGACNTAIQEAALIINSAPTVSILTPASGTVFIAPANFTVLADARDTDGYITNVQLFSAGTSLFYDSTTNPAPYFTVLTNVPAGNYTFTARATDNIGASATSAPVNISVISQPPVTVTSAFHFNPRTGLYEMTVRVSNPTYSTYSIARVYTYGLPSTATLYNASGTANGAPYVQTNATVSAGGYVDVLLQFYLTAPGTPNPTLVGELLPPVTGVTSVSATMQHINRSLLLTNKNFQLEFNSLANRFYYVQYSSDLKNWKGAEPAIIGNGGLIQWVDDGPPKTESLPQSVTARFYRVILVP